MMMLSFLICVYNYCLNHTSHIKHTFVHTYIYQYLHFALFKDMMNRSAGVSLFFWDGTWPPGQTLGMPGLN